MRTYSAFQQWCRRVLKKYPVTTIILAGSRANDCYRPDSNWNVIVCLDDDQYRNEIFGRNLERVIAKEIDFDGLDLLFCRPSGAYYRHWCLLDDGDCDDFCLLDNQGNYSDLYLEIRNRRYENMNQPQFPHSYKPN